mgnify:CR=1 FL=1
MQEIIIICFGWTSFRSVETSHFYVKCGIFHGPKGTFFIRFLCFVLLKTKVFVPSTLEAIQRHPEVASFAERYILFF